MKNRIVIPIVSALILSSGQYAAAQSSPTSFYGVNTRCYDFRQETDTPAPAGYSPIYISHYGRHGSRTGIGTADKYRTVISALRRADSLRILTAAGDSLFNEALQVYDVYDGMDGSLTRRGEAEEHMLAERLYRRYPDVFRKGSRYVRVESSIVPRSIVSGECFVQTLTSLQGDLKFSFDTGDKFFAYINNGSSKEQKAAVAAYRDSLNAAVISDGSEFLRRNFKDSAKAAALIGNPDSFQRLVWELAREGDASGLTVDMFRHLSEDVCRKWWADKVREIYMNHGNSLEYGDDRMKRTEPLVSVILRQARQAVSCGNVAADLKFGHDFPLVAMAGYFGLDGVGGRYGWKDLPEAWAEPDNVPFASNMQMVLYRNRKGNVLVKFVYNGRERKIRDLEPVSGPYYDWEEVYAHFLPEGDERTFALADWGWRKLADGAEVGYAQLDLFGSKQSISVLRYPMSDIRTFIANDSAAQSDSTSALARRYGADAAINASYFNVKTLYPTTYVKDDGRQEGWTRTPELKRVDGMVAVRKGREVRILPSDTLSYESVSRAYREAVASGPILLKDGAEARLSWPGNSFYTGRHPRTFIGTTADGMVYLVVIDGRFKGQGIGTTIHETAEIARMFGLCDALNLDGGGSSVLWTGEYGTISNPYDNHRFDHYGQRVVPNIIYIRK